MEKIKQVYKRAIRELEIARRYYRQSRDDGDQTWMDYWHGVIDAYNRILFDLEDTFGLEE